MTTFVLVPGACHGGWWYEPLVARLESEGHTAVGVTLAGLEQTPELHQPITLERHVDQTADLVTTLASGPDPGRSGVVLVGHSYAGSVITAVADRMPDQVTGLVYLDAFLPNDGESCWQLTNAEQREWYVNGCAATGYGVDPLPFFDDRARPHPIATLLQASRLTGAWRQVATKVYVVALGWPGESPLARSAQRAREEPGFVVHEWDTRHNVMSDGPERVLDLLRDL